MHEPGWRERVTYRAAIIGLSWIATDPPGPPSDPVQGTAVPVSHAAAMAAVPGIDLVAGCDIVPAARDRFVERWGSRWPGLRTYDDYREMLARERPDLVSIVTPDQLHFEPVLASIEAGARAILCEKPLATSLQEADRIVEAARRAGAAMTIEYTRRWMPEFAEARRLAQSGAIGKLSQIVVEMGGPRAMLFRNHTHIIDLIHYFADSDATWVVAELEPGFEGYGTAYRGDGGNDPATEPGANYYVAFDNGIRAYVMGMKTTVGELRVDLIGPGGRVTVDAEGLRLTRVESEDPRTKPSVSRLERPVPSWSVSGIEAALRELLGSLDTGRPPVSAPGSARRPVALTQAILESQARGNVPVAVPRPPAAATPMTTGTEAEG